MPFFNFEENQIFYRQQGSGELLLILPGNTASSVYHQGELDYFSQTHQAVSMDFLGTGQSQRVQTWPVDWWEQGARAAGALIAHLGAERAVVTGASGGAIAALLTAILFPARVKAVIADSGLEIFPPGKLESEADGRDLNNPGAAQFWEKAHGPDWREVVQADSDMLRRFAQTGGDPFRGRLAQIACPVLLTGSLADESLPGFASQMESMARQIPDCSVFYVNQGSHPLMWSRPDVYRRAASAFLETVG